MNITIGEIKSIAKKLNLDMNLVSFIVWVVSFTLITRCGAINPENTTINFENIQRYFSE